MKRLSSVPISPRLFQNSVNICIFKSLQGILVVNAGLEMVFGSYAALVLHAQKDLTEITEPRSPAGKWKIQQQSGEKEKKDKTLLRECVKKKIGEFP